MVWVMISPPPNGVGEKSLGLAAGLLCCCGWSCLLCGWSGSCLLRRLCCCCGGRLLLSCALLSCALLCSATLLRCSALLGRCCRCGGSAFSEHRVLCGFRDSQFHHGFRGNLELLTGLRIDAGTRFPLLLYELTDSGNDEFALLLGLVVSDLRELGEE